MSHVTLTVIVSTDKDDFAARREVLGANGLMSEQIARLVTPIYDGRYQGEIRDIYGNVSGRWDMSEVLDAQPQDEVAVPAQQRPCSCRTGYANSPGIHNNQVRQNGRCPCECHGRR